MDENQLDEVLRDLPREYNAPPPPPLDEMWATIEDAHFIVCHMIGYYFMDGCSKIQD